MKKRSKDYAKLNLNIVLAAQRLKETEKSLRYELAKNRAMIENSDDCIKILDKKGSIVYMNKGGMKEHNFKDAKQAIGWDWISSLEKPYRKKALKALRICLKGKSIEIDVKHLPSGSKRKWCSITLSPIKNGKGRLMQILAISRDISQRKMLEEKLRAKIKRV